MIKLDDIRRHAAVRPEHVAVVDGDTRLTWSQYADAVERAASALAPHLPSDRPARAVFLADNGWELAVATAACATLGVPCTGLDPDHGPDALTQALTRLRPAVVFVGTALRPVLDRCVWPDGPRAVHIVLDGRGAGAATATTTGTGTAAGPGTGPGADGGVARPARPSHRPLSFGRLLESEPHGELPPPLPYEHLAVARGVDGGVRIAVRRTSAEARHRADLVDEFGFAARDVHLAAAPLAEPTALALTRAMLGIGATTVMTARPEPDTLARLLVDERVTTGVVSPSTLARLLADPASDGLAARAGLEFLATPGRQLGRWVVNTAWERLGPVLHLAQGSAETGLTAILPADEVHAARVRSGRVTLGSTVALLGDDDRPVPVGAAGRVAVTGYQVMDGYLDDDAEFVTLDLGTGERRWLLTGEVGRLDDTGRLCLTGRTGGVPSVARDSAVDKALFRLESDLLNLPCLRDTAVMRVNVPALGDALVVPFIAVAVGREATGYQALSSVCKRRVPSLPAHVIAVDTIPYSPTGRIRDTELLESVLPIITLNHQLEQTMQQEMSA
ncbi:class I adenylate-forming enzyme family protein [Streptomyces sp. NPDC047928]|uniref:class I adenylate-forming enzyme family protein n=1 Tax=unclassified Streptomyces TaxID=2593676 RepID=UPI003712C939